MSCIWGKTLYIFIKNSFRMTLCQNYIDNEKKAKMDNMKKSETNKKKDFPMIVKLA